MLCSAMPTDLSLLRYMFEICTTVVFFCDLMEFGRFAHRKRRQNDAGMNLAFFMLDGIIGRNNLSQTI